MVSFAGIPFEIEPRAALTTAEREWLDGIEREGEVQEHDPLLSNPLRFRIVPTPPWRFEPGPPLAPSEPAEFSYEGDLVRLRRDDFAAEIDPFDGECRFYRTGRAGLSIQVALKVFLACCLPLSGGLTLHSAGLVRAGEGLLFFGPSGAGKSTICGLSPFPVLSDEIVAIVPMPLLSVRATGFWGTFDRSDALRGTYSVRAAFALEKGLEFEAARLSPALAVRRLLGVTLIPSAPRLWQGALALIERFVRSVPVYRMSWTPEASPWESIERVLQEGS